MSDKKYHKLDDDEQAIEDGLDSVFEQSDLSEVKWIVEAAANTAKKSKNVSLRLTEKDMTKLQAKALEEGVPYQTLMTSIIHLYLSGMLIRKQH